jgi:hypothetical protein
MEASSGEFIHFHEPPEPLAKRTFFQAFTSIGNIEK